MSETKTHQELLDDKRKLKKRIDAITAAQAELDLSDDATNLKLQRLQLEYQQLCVQVAFTGDEYQDNTKQVQADIVASKQRKSARKDTVVCEPDDMPVAVSAPEPVPAVASAPDDVPVAVSAPEPAPAVVSAPDDVPVAISAPETAPAVSSESDDVPIAVSNAPEPTITPFAAMQAEYHILPARINSARAELDALTRRYAELHTTITTRGKQIEQLHRAIDDYAARLRAQEKRADALTSGYEKAQQRADQAREEMTTATTQAEQLAATLAQLQHELAELIGSKEI